MTAKPTHHEPFRLAQAASPPAYARCARELSLVWQLRRGLTSLKRGGAVTRVRLVKAQDLAFAGCVLFVVQHAVLMEHGQPFKLLGGVL
jgi:hypothetical protein